MPLTSGFSDNRNLHWKRENHQTGNQTVIKEFPFSRRKFFQLQVNKST